MSERESPGAIPELRRNMTPEQWWAEVHGYIRQTSELQRLIADLAQMLADSVKGEGPFE